MNYFLAPRSGEKSYINFQSSLKHGVPLEKIVGFLTNQEREILLQEEIIYAWGNRKGTKSAWEIMRGGDLVIFYAKGRLVMTGEVYLKKHDPGMALTLWPADDNGNPWEYVFFVRNLKYISIPILTFNKIVDFRPKFVVQKFIQLKQERIALINKEYGSIHTFLNTFTDNASNEVAGVQDKIYINLSKNIQPLILNDASIRPKKAGEYVIKPSKYPVKIDYMARNKANNIVGDKGEEIVYSYERARLQGLNRSDLAMKVTRVSVTDDSLGYDILSFEENGLERFIEVKATAGYPKAIYFHVSAKEYNVGKEKHNYYIYFVEGTESQAPKITPIKSPMDESKFFIKPDGYIFEADR